MKIASPSASRHAFGTENFVMTQINYYVDPPEEGRDGVWHGAHDRASPNFMWLASLGLRMGIFCDFLYSVFFFNAILWLEI
jgi:hypothetical protein